MNDTTQIFLFVSVGLVLLMIPQQAYKVRGLRNNNPGNIRAGDPWRGMTGTDDAGFVIFEGPEWGIRAMQRILNSYRARGLVSVRQIISTWAPPNENKTGAYVDHVAAVLGVSPDETLSPDYDGALIGAIIKHENGAQPYSAAVIEQGRALA